MTKQVDMEHTPIPTEHAMLVNGYRTSKMVLDAKFGLMEKCTRESTRMAAKMEKDS